MYTQNGHRHVHEHRHRLLLDWRIWLHFRKICNYVYIDIKIKHNCEVSRKYKIL
jgi:hypothetical protein